MKTATRNKNQGWRVVGDKRIFGRSKWEANFAKYLQFLKSIHEIKDWFHEPQCFWFEGIKRGCCSYLPDFKIIEKNDRHYWIEVKGYMDSKSTTKIKRFAKYFPEEELRIIDGKWFKQNNKKMRLIIKDWE